MTWESGADGSSPSAEVVAVEDPGAALATILGVMPDVLLIDIAMWPTRRERRSRRGGEPPRGLQGIAGGNVEVA